MAVYLIHLSQPFKHARHYIGFTEQEDMAALMQRIEYHRDGRGSRLLSAVAAAGIDMWVVRHWPGLTRDDERRLKRRGGAKRLCPVCRTNKEELLVLKPLGRSLSMD